MRIKGKLLEQLKKLFYPLNVVIESRKDFDVCVVVASTGKLYSCTSITDVMLEHISKMKIEDVRKLVLLEMSRMHQSIEQKIIEEFLDSAENGTIISPLLKVKRIDVINPSELEKYRVK